MESNRRVLLFVVTSFSIFLLVSILSFVFNFEWLPLKRVNLISDIVRSNDSRTAEPDPISNEPLIVDKVESKNFELYHKGRFINAFNTDTTISSLPSFASKLHDLRNGRKRKIRIAYFGDSMIEGDLLTQTFRKLLQSYFGGSGVGYVPVNSPVSKFRQTASTSASGWTDINFKSEGNTSRLYFSGYLFKGSGASLQVTDHTITDTISPIEKSILYGPANTSFIVNGSSHPVSSNALFNRTVVQKDLSRTVRIGSNDVSVPVYGVTFESESGVIVDNFSFRGITGVELAAIDSSFLSSINNANPYDLIVFQYGVNLLFRPNDKNFSWYAKNILPVVKKLRACFPQTDFIVVSTADRAFRYGTEYKSAVGIDSLIKVQAALAWQTNSAFYNQFETMGGHNSIVDWASRTPSLANKDYVHPNHRGAEVLGRLFFDAILEDYNKYVRTLK